VRPIFISAVPCACVSFFSSTAQAMDGASVASTDRRPECPSARPNRAATRAGSGQVQLRDFARVFAVTAARGERSIGITFMALPPVVGRLVDAGAGRGPAAGDECTTQTARQGDIGGTYRKALSSPFRKFTYIFFRLQLEVLGLRPTITHARDQGIEVGAGELHSNGRAMLSK